MDSRLAYLLVLLPPLPALGEAPALPLAGALALLRQQGGRSLDALIVALGAEAPLRAALEDGIGCPPDHRGEPADLPPALRRLFAEEAAAALPEADWVTGVWRAYLGFLAESGRRAGSRLLPRWAAWEGELRAALAARRVPAGAPPGAGVAAADPELAAAVAAWERIRERGREAPLAAAMEAELSLDRARLAFLERASVPYSFTLDELVSYLLRLRVLERYPRLDPAKGRALLREVASL